MLETEDKQKIGDCWSKKVEPVRTVKMWWHIAPILQHINKKVSGRAVNGFSQGLTDIAIQMRSSKPSFKKGISVGCGNAAKEMRVIQAGLVEQFDLFELSEARIQRGHEIAKKLAVSDKVNFHLADAFEVARGEGSYDFVHWNNALHHMPNVAEAVAWSFHVLKPGGMFYLDDYVGPNRFQWTDEMLAIASEVRATLPKKYLINPADPEKHLPVNVVRPDRKRIIDLDPSEAGDSERILDAVRLFFPNALIALTGGVIYHLALSSMLNNFDVKDDNDRTLLSSLLLLDSVLADKGLTHYATALAIK